MKRQGINKPAAAAALACPEACHADQPLDVSFLHRGDKHSRRFGEKPRRLEDDFGTGRNAERLDDGTDSALLAPMMRTVATASCSWSDPPGSLHVLAGQPHRKRGGRLETHSNAWRSHAARSCVAAKMGWLSLEKTARTLIEICSPSTR